MIPERMQDGRRVNTKSSEGKSVSIKEREPNDNVSDRYSNNAYTKREEERLLG